MTAPKLTASAVSAAVRRAIGAGKAKAQTRDQIETPAGLVTVSVWVTVHAGEDAARAAAAELIRAGYEVTRTGTILTVALPEPTEDDEPVIVLAGTAGPFPTHEEPVQRTAEEVVAESERRAAADEPVATLAELQETVDALDALPAPRITTREELIARQIAAGATPERAAMIADARDRLQTELTANADKIAAALADEPGDDGLVHLMSDGLLDACETAGPGRLVVAPDTTPERITCPACRLLITEADVPPTVDERVTVRIRAAELRPGDEVVDSLGNRQYAAFDVAPVDDDDLHLGYRTVRVWTAVADQERGLPPVMRVPAIREVLVLRPLSDEGRELIAALDRVTEPAPEFGSPAWALSLLPENRRA